MNLKKTIKIVLFISLLLIIVIVLKRKNTLSDNHLSQIIDNYETLQIKTDSLILEKFVVFNEKNESFSIIDLLSDKKLIYRFGELHCKSCIMNEFKNLKKQISTNKKNIENVLIITHYQNPRNLYLFKRINKLQNFEIFNLVDNGLKFELDDIGMPYFFTLDKNMKINNTFIPIKNYNKRTDDYLKKVLSKIKSY